MNAPISFASAYRQLAPAEKAYVDAYVADVERDAQRTGERISNALYRPVPDAVMAASRGMLEKPLVRAAITERINTLATDNELSVPRIVKELMTVAFASLGDYMELIPTVPGTSSDVYFDLTKCTPEQLAAVKKVKIEENMRGSRKFEIELYSKLDALGKLAQYVGMLDADNPHWRAETARPVGPSALPATVTVDDAASAHARQLEGGA